MTDYVTIANLALQKIGAEDTVVAPDQDSTAARSIAAAWDSVRQATIRGGKRAPRWTFAMSYREVPARAASAARPVPFGWTAAYPEPVDTVRLVEILSPAIASDGDWLLAGGEILLRATGPLKAWFLVDVPEVTKWDALFVETFAAALAYQVADRITGDRARKQDCWAEYQANLSAATKVNARENPPVEQEESDWVATRWSGPINRTAMRRIIV